jgi:hypothetical protein
MTRVSVRIEGHYEVHEAPFSRSYEWHPASLTLVCDCGEELTLTSASTTPTCWCGADYSALISDIQEREAQLREAATHPWRHEAKDQAEQHLRDEAAYPEGSPQRYEDVMSGLMDDEEERWKKAREHQLGHSSSAH